MRLRLLALLLWAGAGLSPTTLFAQQTQVQMPSSVIGVWMTDSYFPWGITITDVEPDGKIKGCYWGWEKVHWHGSDNSIGDPALYDTANRFVAIFGQVATGVFDGSTVTIRNNKTQGVYSLSYRPEQLFGAYTNPIHPNWNHQMTVRKTGQTGTNCPRPAN